MFGDLGEPAGDTLAQRLEDVVDERSDARAGHYQNPGGTQPFELLRQPVPGAGSEHDTSRQGLVDEGALRHGDYRRARHTKDNRSR
jgi:hypothetical protein